jgi:hypothetical protein
VKKAGNREQGTGNREQGTEGSALRGGTAGGLFLFGVQPEAWGRFRPVVSEGMDKEGDTEAHGQAGGEIDGQGTTGTVDVEKTGPQRRKDLMNSPKSHDREAGTLAETTVDAQ